MGKPLGFRKLKDEFFQSAITQIVHLIMNATTTTTTTTTTTATTTTTTTYLYLALPFRNDDLMISYSR